MQICFNALTLEANLKGLDKPTNNVAAIFNAYIMAIVAKHVGTGKC